MKERCHHFQAGPSCCSAAWPGVKEVFKRFLHRHRQSEGGMALVPQEQTQQSHHGAQLARPLKPLSYEENEVMSDSNPLSNSDTHGLIGTHAPPRYASERGTPRCRPGFNINVRQTMSEDEDSSSRSFDSASLIDNSVLVYIPMQLKCGVTVQCRPDVLARCPSVLKILNRDVERCLEVLPPSVHNLVRRTNIWVNTTYYYGHRDKPRNVNHSTAHHHEGWLFWARDKPEKATGIEIYNCFDYQTMRLHWNGCGLLLHEFCHLIHQLTLPDGLENSTVIDAFEMATKSGLYDNTLRRDWAGLDCEEDMAYCMVNHKEFFSELSVTFLADAYHEYDEAEMRMEECSPPLMAPSVVERVRSKGYDLISVDDRLVPSDRSLEPLLKSESSVDHVANKVQRPVVDSFYGVWQLLNRRDSELNWTRFSHCNKFYPFTKGQLKHHDPDLFAVYTDLWTQIGAWRDDKKENPCLRLIRNCWPK